MPRAREQILVERRELKTNYAELYDSVAALLFRYDPIGISFDTNKDEYESEVGTILPRLKSCHSADEVRRVVHEEFVRWFGSGTAGPLEHYTEIADELWRVWKAHPQLSSEHSGNI
jgi:hypothetical protein